MVIRTGAGLREHGAIDTLAKFVRTTVNKTKLRYFLIWVSNTLSVFSL